MRRHPLATAIPQASLHAQAEAHPNDGHLSVSRGFRPAPGVASPRSSFLGADAPETAAASEPGPGVSVPGSVTRWHTPTAFAPNTYASPPTGASCPARAPPAATEAATTSLSPALFDSRALRPTAAAVLAGPLPSAGSTPPSGTPHNPAAASSTGSAAVRRGASSASGQDPPGSRCDATIRTLQAAVPTSVPRCGARRWAHTYHSAEPETVWGRSGGSIHSHAPSRPGFQRHPTPRASSLLNAEGRCVSCFPVPLRPQGRPILG